MTDGLWIVDFEVAVKEQIARQMAEGVLDSEDLGVIKKWVVEVEESGLAVAQGNTAWRDHELFDEWKGHRAISFSIDGRLIYRVEDKKLTVMVVKITGDHNYKK